jgi:hypothetical protein
MGCMSIRAGRTLFKDKVMRAKFQDVKNVTLNVSDVMQTVQM